jgi:3-oxoacyl-[acyl-carrier protein] reductase
VTGASGGIGRAVAKRLLADGARVVLSDRTRADSLRAAEALDAEPGRVHIAPADIADPDQARACVHTARTHCPELDLLVNAAGLYPSTPLLEMTDAQWRRVLAVNLDAAFTLSTEFARLLVADARPGHILNITSGAADRARRGAAHYCSSKAGLTMLTKALAVELAEHRIHVNAVSPGYIPVDSEVNPLREEYTRAIEAGRPWPRPGVPADVGRARSRRGSRGAGPAAGDQIQPVLGGPERVLVDDRDHLAGGHRVHGEGDLAAHRRDVTDLGGAASDVGGGDRLPVDPFDRGSRIGRHDVVAAEPRLGAARRDVVGREQRDVLVGSVESDTGDVRLDNFKQDRLLDRMAALLRENSNPRAL